MVLSQEHVAMRRESGENWHALTTPLWPLSVATCTCVVSMRGISRERHVIDKTDVPGVPLETVKCECLAVVLCLFAYLPLSRRLQGSRRAPSRPRSTWPRVSRPARSWPSRRSWSGLQGFAPPPLGPFTSRKPRPPHLVLSQQLVKGRVSFRASI